jgi:replicative DNA helicase
MFLNLASALLKKVIVTDDLATWALIEAHYFPPEYQKLYKAIDKHLSSYNELPSFEALELSIREPKLQEQIASLKVIEVPDIDAYQLLDYLKNEFTQTEILTQLEKYVDNTVAMATAEESITALQDIIVTVESKVDLKDPEEDMSRMSLFDSQDDIERSLAMGLNSEYDNFVKFSPRDLILIGGRRGSGKSLTCANVAANVYSQGGSAIYFTIEMTSRSIMQRIAAISTGVPVNAIRNRNLSISEWEKVAKWWAGRFDEGHEVFDSYREHRSFDKFHEELTKRALRPNQVDVVYEPSLTISKLQAEIDYKMKTIRPKVIIVDYLNQLKRVNSKSDQYDWKEQIEISKALKSMAQEYEVPFISPYQTDATGEARMSKGILDAPDAAFALETYKHEDNVISFNCVKMRNGEEQSFTSVIDWATLRIGPESARIPGGEEAGDEEIEDI